MSRTMPPLFRQFSLLAAFFLFSGCLQFTGGDDDDTAVADDDDTAVADDDDTAVADDDDTAVADDDDTAVADDDDSTPAVVDDDGDGVPLADDCDDNDALSTVVAEDADCDGVVTAADCDDNSATSTVVAEDADCDGSLTSVDCADNDDANYPGNTEVCDGADNDCDTVVPIDELDDDGDRYVECTWVGTAAEVDGGDDCDDGDATAFPGNAELCDGIDNDCVGGADFVASDDDGGGEVHSDSDSVLDCADCADGDSNNYPGNTEQCDGVDTDCVGGADFVTSDDDGGGEAHSDSDSVLDCADCADGDSNNYPGNAEQCDGADNNCLAGADFVAQGNANGDDGGDEVTDSDNDGSLDCADCEDNNGANYPGNSEVCDGADNDCVGGADFVTTADDGGGEVHSDNDNVLDCADCADGDSDNYPGNAEQCDGFDNDCVGGADFPSSNSLTTTFAGSNGNFGNIFDVETISGVTITGFDWSLDSTSVATVEVYYRVGSGLAVHNDPSAWTLLQQFSVTGQGEGNATELDLTTPLVLSAGQTYGFAFHSTVEIDYSNGVSVGSVYAQNDDLIVYEGYGKGTVLFSNHAVNGRVWNGTIHYETSGEVDVDNDTYLACEECNDSTAAANPGLPESYSASGTCQDNLDNDCDGFIDGSDLGCQFIINPPIGGGGGILN